jgi:sortase A
MRARVTWNRDFQKRHRAGRAGVRALEWIFLLAGLMAVIVYVWMNTTSVLYQAYEDWAFDQTLRGLKPTPGEFVSEEAHALLGRGHEKPASAEIPKASPEQNGGAPLSSPPAPQTVIGRLEIPRLKLAVMVREGADEGTLSRAVGHIPGTALPGRIGNVGLAGHRDTFFRKLRNIHANDTIELQTTNGTYRYLVQSTRIVTPRDVSVLNASGGETLTLVTCYPFYYVGSAPKRFIVHATQVGASPRHSPQPNS